MLNDSEFNNFLDLAYQLINEGISNYKEDFHECVFSSLNFTQIEQRCVVLRRFVPKRRTLMFHTDIRSPKVSQIKNNPNTSIFLYSKKNKLQLRFKCYSHVQFKNRLSRFVFAQTSSNQRECYQYSLYPSSKISSKTKELVYEESPHLKKVSPEDNFSVIVSNYSHLDLLSLHHKGHTRIQYSWDKQGVMQASYLVA